MLLLLASDGKVWASLSQTRQQAGLGRRQQGRHRARLQAKRAGHGQDCTGIETGRDAVGTHAELAGHGQQQVPNREAL